MATAKKTTAAKKPAAKKPVAKPSTAKVKVTAAKKTPATKKTVTAKSVAKKAPAKRATASSARRKATKAPAMRSFRLARDQQAFTEFSITRQTVYWVILVAFIVFAQLWILKLQVEVATLIDARQAQVMEMQQ